MCGALLPNASNVKCVTAKIKYKQEEDEHVQMWGETFSFRYIDLNYKLSFFAKAIPRFYKHIPLVEEYQRKRCKKRYVDDTIGPDFYRTAYSSSFSEKKFQPCY